jgi:hypothetical protein
MPDIGRRAEELAVGGVGNLVGAVVFVATSYWYLFLEDRPERLTVAEKPAERA